MTAALDLMNNIGRCFPLSLQGLCHAFVEAKPVVDASREFLLIVTYVDQRCPESFTQCGDDVSQMGSLLFVETLTGLASPAYQPPGSRLAPPSAASIWDASAVSTNCGCAARSDGIIASSRRTWARAGFSMMRNAR